MATTLESIRDSLPGYARDLALNLGTVLTPAGAPRLNERQIWSVALAAAVASGNAASPATSRGWPCGTWMLPT